MKRIKLTALEAENFKGLGVFSIKFGDRTDIAGPNASGKTSLYDAFMWVVTGKDSTGTEAFKVQPVNGDNVVIPNLQTSVKATFSVDGQVNVFERKLSQKWSKPKGTETPVLKGNESMYLVNGVPVKQAEYTAKVAEILCRPDDFTMLTSPGAFLRLSTNEKRRRLMAMAGNLEEILTETNYPALYAAATEAKSVEGAVSAAKLALKNLKDEIAGIPDRLSENERDMPTGIDFAALEEKKNSLNEEIKTLDKALADIKVSDRDVELKKKLATLENERMERIDLAEKSYRDEISCRDKSVSEMSVQESMNSFEVAILRHRLAESDAIICELEKRLQEKGAQWKAVNSSKFDDKVESECPMCHRPFSANEIESMRNSLIEAFNRSKVSELEVITEEGRRIRADLDEAVSRRNGLNEELSKAEDALSELSSEKTRAASREVVSVSERLQHDDCYKAANAEIELIKASLSSPYDNDDMPKTIAERKGRCMAELETVISQLALESQVKRVAERRMELTSRQTEISAAMAAREKILYEYAEYKKAHITAVENRVASMFTIVRFQMYEPNLTNDGEKEICECLVDGVPYSSNLNTASRVNAGIDIINALSKWIGVCAPVWIDNKESVQTLIESDSQIVTLSVEQTENGMLTVSNL